MSTCLICKTKTKNPKFCSRSCAAKHNNKIPKRNLEGKCECCKQKISSTRKYCKSCFTLKFSAKDITLKEAIYTHTHKASAYSLVRSRARMTEKMKNNKKCYNCGYDKHVEVCHINPISSFSEDTLLSVINHDQNLIALCPNCHWEFDHGLLKLDLSQELA
jgi:hypothetical protein